MIITVAKEQESLETRVILTPGAVQRLVEKGHGVSVERGAGECANFTDEEYVRAGAQILFGEDEAFGRGEIVLKIGCPTPQELDLTHPGQTIMGLHHWAVAPREAFQALLERQVTVVGLELIEDDDGMRPIMYSMSEIAGAMAIFEAGHLLMSHGGGRGVLLGRAPGIRPATVVILGAGAFGRNAARVALGCGAQVILLDSDLEGLRWANMRFERRVITGVYDRASLAKLLPNTDVLIGSAYVPAGRAPDLVTREMVRLMRPGAVIIDASIDQGGCVETSRPTTLLHPTFTWEGIIHYCVPNMPANVGRTASYALTNSTFPYIERIADLGMDEAIRQDSELCRGLYAHQGFCRQESTAKLLDVEHRPLDCAACGRG
jgi:alanine dehydrogenase